MTKSGFVATPSISIVTVVLNNKEGLEATLESVSKNSRKDVEHIIIDGNSTDGTVEVIERWAASVSYWCSEKDSGLYDAMNKGIRASSGDYLWFVNAADRVLKIPLPNEIYVDDRDTPHAIAFPVVEVRGKKRTTYFGRITPPHQGLLYSRKVFDLYGNFNSDYKLISDRLFFDKIRDKEVKIIRKNSPICLFDLNGISRKPEGRRVSRAEWVRAFLRRPTVIGFYRMLRACCGNFSDMIKKR